MVDGCDGDGGNGAQKFAILQKKGYNYKKGGYMYCYHGYHATNELSEIRHSGVVKPMRLPCVYLFTDIDAAKRYCDEFGYSGVVKVAYMSCDIAGRWKPKYCFRGGVVRLKPGATADYIQVAWTRKC